MEHVAQRQIQSAITNLRLNLDEIYSWLNDCPEMGDNGVAEAVISLTNDTDVLQARFDNNIRPKENRG